MSLPGESRSGADIKIHATFHGSPTRASSPIQIPKKRSSIVIPSISAPDQAISPEMIFEMSPVTSEFSVHQHTPFSKTDDNDNHDAFLYTFPKISPNQNPPVPGSSDPNPASLLGTTPRICSKPSHGANISTVKRPLPHRSHCMLDEYDLSFGNPPPKKVKTRKITGFLPVRGRQDSVGMEEDQPSERNPSAGPRRSSYHPSPWIFPGKGAGTEEDVAYSETDPSAFEFQRHLLRRIENQSRSRLKGLPSYI